MKKRTTQLRLFTASGWVFYCDSLYEFAPGTVLHVKGTIWLIVHNDGQWGAVSKENKPTTLLHLEELIRKEGFGVVVYIPDDADEHSA
nr:MAG TPA: hypothetical protein [Caudoviricetes sp.]